MRRRIPFVLLASLTPAIVVAACATGSGPGRDGGSPAGGGSSCGACHPEEDRPLAVHAGLEEGCAACHGPDPHGTPEDPEDGCRTCHGQETRSFLLPFGHRLAGLASGGGLRCGDCHEPHAPRPRRIRSALAAETCIRCHREEGGPFVFFHALEADRNRGCLACHEPHGSANKRALTSPLASQLCLSCHGLELDDHNLNPRFAFMECMKCHNRVHGSDWSHLLDR